MTPCHQCATILPAATPIACYSRSILDSRYVSERLGDTVSPAKSIDRVPQVKTGDTVSPEKSSDRVPLVKLGDTVSLVMSQYYDISAGRSPFVRTPAKSHSLPRCLSTNSRPKMTALQQSERPLRWDAATHQWHRSMSSVDYATVQCLLPPKGFPYDAPHPVHPVNSLF